MWYNFECMEMSIIENDKIDTSITADLSSDDTRKHIRTLFLRGIPIKDIQERLNIKENNWLNAYYDNYRGFREYIDELKRLRVLAVVERFSTGLMSRDDEDNTKLTAIQQKEAEFLRETLLKDHGYTKRVENIGLNINKNEPLDAEQKAKLDKLLGVAGYVANDTTDPTQEAEVIL